VISLEWLCPHTNQQLNQMSKIKCQKLKTKIKDSKINKHFVEIYYGEDIVISLEWLCPHTQQRL